ncbi:MAG: hypothetical protein ACKV0T_13040, partial [Planctomycetales bacterium]
VGGTFQIDQNSSIQNLQLGAGTLTGTGDITVTGTMEWSGGGSHLSGTGTLNIAPGAVLNVYDPSHFKYLDGRTVNNAGMATVYHGSGGRGVL